jgi:hypothetical protein
MPGAPYSVLEVQREWVLAREAMGSKEKFWYRAEESGPEWLFKLPQPNTGQHWAEKIAAELAACLDIPHGRVELAVFDGCLGSAAESFAHGGRNLFHGNQILAGKVLGYDPARRFRQADHTLGNILLALDKLFLDSGAAERAKTQFATYLVLDAAIGNTDRHHENWGIPRERVGARWLGELAPSFDHASSLGREMLDEAPGKCRRRLLSETRIGAYTEKATGAIYWDPADKRGLSPLELVRRAARIHPGLLRPALDRLERLDLAKVAAVVERIPEDWMTPLAREFAVELAGHNLHQLRSIL